MAQVGAKRLLATFLLVAMSLATAQVPPLHLLTEDDPPFNQLEPNGQVGGVASVVVREMFARAGVPYTLELVPWLRAYNSAELNRDTCVYSTIRNSAREQQFKWVGPLVETPWALFARLDRHKDIAVLNEARHSIIGGYSGDAVAQYLIDHGFNVALTSSDALNVRKLVAGRIDYWATGKYHGQYLVAEAKAALIPILVFNHSFMYLACNPAVPDSTIEILNQALQTMHNDGFFRKVHHHYLGD